MDFSKLFPANTQDPTQEFCSVDGQKVLLDNVSFSPIPIEKSSVAHWVDGGSAMLFSTPTRAIALLRKCTVTTNGLQRQGIDVQTFLASATDAGEKFIVSGQSLTDHKVPDCLNVTIPKSELPTDATAEIVLELSRVLLEHNAGVGEATGPTILDGSFRTSIPFLQKHITAHQNNHHSIAKTTGILTSKQRPIGMALLTRAQPGTWSAELNADTVIARLHHKASHVFLVENSNPELLSLLHSWSNDASFPGYPYPLILADQLARVTNNERDAWKLLIASDDNARKVLTGELKASDAHAMLEHILYGKELL